jgi:hypothetical protein
VIAVLPNGNEERLITRAARTVTAVCGKSSNPWYQPFEAAEALLTEELEDGAR